VITAIVQLAYKDKANGSLVVRDGKIIGSALLAQQFPGGLLLLARAVCLHRWHRPVGACSLEQRKGNDLTVAKPYSSYVEYCKQPYLRAYAEAQFQRHLTVLLREAFGVLKSHDLTEIDLDETRHCPRGFHGLGLKVEVQAHNPKDD
jgi:hypothetical protein